MAAPARVRERLSRAPAGSAPPGSCRRAGPGAPRGRAAPAADRPDRATRRARRPTSRAPGAPGAARPVRCRASRTRAGRAGTTASTRSHRNQGLSTRWDPTNNARRRATRASPSSAATSSTRRARTSAGAGSASHAPTVTSSTCPPGGAGVPRTCTPSGRRVAEAAAGSPGPVSRVAPSQRVASTSWRSTWTNSSSASGGRAGSPRSTAGDTATPRPAHPVVASPGTGGTVSARPRTRRPATRRPGSAQAHHAAGRRHGAVASPRTTAARSSRLARSIGTRTAERSMATSSVARSTSASASPPQPAVRSVTGAPAKRAARHAATAGWLACSAADGVHHVWDGWPAPRARRDAAAIPCTAAALAGSSPAARSRVATARSSSEPAPRPAPTLVAEQVGQPGQPVGGHRPGRRVGVEVLAAPGPVGHLVLRCRRGAQTRRRRSFAAGARDRSLRADPAITRGPDEEPTPRWQLRRSPPRRPRRSRPPRSRPRRPRRRRRRPRRPRRSRPRIDQEGLHQEGHEEGDVVQRRRPARGGLAHQGGSTRRGHPRLG